jgi:putative ABC transport system permease protein
MATLSNLETIWQDARYGVRMLRKGPGFTAVAVLTLALGIGANTAIFSAVNSILFRPLPYTDAKQLVTVAGYKHFSGNIMAYVSFSPDVWSQIRQQATGIARMATYDPGEFTLSGTGAPEIVSGARVTGDFFPLLGVKPLFGRPILPADTQPGHACVAVLTWKLWREVFGGDTGVVHRSITLDENRCEVIGVMPRDVDFAASGRALWLPLIAVSRNDSDVLGDVIVRMNANVTGAALTAQLKTVSARISDNFSGVAKNAELIASPLRADRFSDLQPGLVILSGAVVFVLLIGCLNVSNLLLARGWHRQRELAIRSALGASRLRIVRQLLSESATIAIFGGVLAVAVARAIIGTLGMMTPPDFLRGHEFRLDWRVLLFTLAISATASFAFGLLPAVQLSASDPRSAIYHGDAPAAGAFARRPHRLRAALVVFQVALAVVLVSGAILLARSFQKLITLDLGLRTDHVLAVSASLNKSVCDSRSPQSLDRCIAAVNDILSRVRELPDVELAAATSGLPLHPGGLALTMQIEGRQESLGLETGDVIGYRAVTPGYFRALNVSLKSGRDFSLDDTKSSELVAIVNETFVRKFFNSNPLGRRIARDKNKDRRPHWMQIVGVVADSHDLEIAHTPVAEYYLPFAQSFFFPGAQFIVRTAVGPMAVAAAVRSQLWAVDKNAPVELQTMNDVMREQVAEPRFQMLLISSFGVLGMLLAMVGLYGSISYGVSQRTHELGVRTALGAMPGGVLRMVIREGMMLVLMGLVVGIAGALAMSRTLQSFLFEMKATDPSTYTVVSLLLAIVALLACYVPARRASRVDPMVALRYE